MKIVLSAIFGVTAALHKLPSQQTLARFEATSAYDKTNVQFAFVDSRNSTYLEVASFFATTTANTSDSC